LPELGPQSVERLRRGCDSLGLHPAEEQYRLWLQYLELLLKWNRTYNLTAIRKPDEMITRHLLDSLAIAPYLDGESIIDVGTGAGLPGVPLAILFPERDIDLLDSNGKKTRFLFQVKTSLRLDNIRIHNQRVESFNPVTRYDLVLSRAFASLHDMVAGCRQLVRDNGRLLAMKGTRPTAEIASIEHLCRRVEVEAITVPGLDEQRHIIKLALA
jgi:16S rRNA (guanine527-N7)-methyltransferase